jgi:hypothetical protein
VLTVMVLGADGAVMGTRVGFQCFGGADTHLLTCFLVYPIAGVVSQ